MNNSNIDKNILVFMLVQKLNFKEIILNILYLTCFNNIQIFLKRFTYFALKIFIKK